VVEVADRVLRAEGVRHAIISIAFVTNRRIAALNRTHLGHRGATDVISFGLRTVEAAGPAMGDIYVAPDVARENARRHGGSIREEVLRLVVHGVLHVLGHEHPEGEERYTSPMWRRQERLLRAAGGAP
jgi:probable rRNA maturation factor